MEEPTINIHCEYFQETLKKDIKQIHNVLIHELFHSRVNSKFKIGSLIEIVVDKRNGKVFGEHLDCYPNKYKNIKYIPLIVFVHFIHFIWDLLCNLIFLNLFPYYFYQFLLNICSYTKIILRKDD